MRSQLSRTAWRPTLEQRVTLTRPNVPLKDEPHEDLSEPDQPQVESSDMKDDSDWESIYTMATESESGKDGSQLKVSDEPNLLFPQACTEPESPAPYSPITESPPSPISVPGYMDNGITSDETERAGLEQEPPGVVIAEHFPGENDTMSGALSQRDESNTLRLSDENIISECVFDLNIAIATMPYKIIRRYDLFRLNLPFDNLGSLALLPEHFLTTYRGVGRALEDVADQMSFSDEVLIEAIGRRGGFCRNDVVYPEDIVPWEVRDHNGNWAQGFDEAYWMELQAQGRIWGEIYVP